MFRKTWEKWSICVVLFVAILVLSIIGAWLPQRAYAEENPDESKSGAISTVVNAMGEYSIYEEKIVIKVSQDLSITVPQFDYYTDGNKYKALIEDRSSGILMVQFINEAELTDLPDFLYHERGNDICEVHYFEDGTLYLIYVYGDTVLETYFVNHVKPFESVSDLCEEHGYLMSAISNGAEIIDINGNMRPSAQMLKANASFVVTQGMYDDYTDSDYYVDGKTIRNYVYGENIIDDISYCDDITKIIPMDLFRNRGDFLYVGKEYGFFVTTTYNQDGDSTSNASDVVVFDIEKGQGEIINNGAETEIYTKVTYLFSHSYKYYTKAESGSDWSMFDPNATEIVTGSRFEGWTQYYIKDISYANVIYSENKLNPGQASYVEDNDTGVHIIQSRLNWYGSMVEESQEGELAHATINYILGIIPFSEPIENILNVISKIDDTFTLLGNAESSLKINHPDYILSNEDNITFGGNVNGLSKMSALRLNAADEKTPVLIENQYSDYINIIGNYNDNWFRVYQTVDLQLARLDRGPFGTSRDIVDIISGSGMYYKSFGNSNASTPIEIEGDQELVVLLPEGINTLSLDLPYSGVYKFSMGDSLQKSIDVVDNQGTIIEHQQVTNTLNLHLKGGKYLLRISYVDEKADGAFVVSSEYQKLNMGNNAITIYGTSAADTILSLEELPADLYIVVSNSSVTYNLLDKNFVPYENGSGTNFGFIADGKAGYLILNSGIGGSLTLNVSAKAVEEDTEIAINEYPGYFKFRASEDGKYGIIVSGVSTDFSLEYYNIVEVAQVISAGDMETYLFYLEQGQEIWLKISDVTPITIRFAPQEETYQWVINDEAITGDTVSLARGSQTTIEILIAGEVIPSDILTVRTAAAGYTYHSFSNGILTIDSDCPVYGKNQAAPVVLEFEIEGVYIATLSVYVLHNLQLNFNVYYGTDEFGVQNTITGKASGESLVVHYLISSSLYYIDDFELASSDNKVNIKAQTVDKNSDYLHQLFIDVTIISIELNGTEIYNTEWNGYDNLSEMLKLQHFTYATLQVHPLFNGGTGSLNDPYKIANERNLNNLRYCTSSYNSETYIYGNFKLVSSITLSKNWEPIPYRFSGTFDGGHYSIHNMKIVIPALNASSNSSYGLFSNVSGTIKNLNMHSVSITKSTQGYSDIAISVGAIAGYLNGGTITQCMVYGSIDVMYPEAFVGGVVGNAYLGYSGTISSCVNSISIKGCGTLGGIAGFAYASRTSSAGIISCDNLSLGTIYLYRGDPNYDREQSKLNCAGGIVGHANNILIKYCSNYVSVRWAETQVIDSDQLNPSLGRIVGYASSTVQLESCSAKGKVDKGNLQSPYKYGFLWLSKYYQDQYVDVDGKSQGEQYIGFKEGVNS